MDHPGSHDAHIHFALSGGSDARPDIFALRDDANYAQTIATVRANVEATLARYIASGVTGVVDVGGPMWTFDVRDLAESLTLSPRVAVSGPLLATYVPPEIDVDDPIMLRIRTRSAARAQVQRQLARFSDMTKIWFIEPRGSLDAELDWVEAAIAESHDAGVPVAAHATERRVAEAMVALGADFLVHGVSDALLRDATLERMREAGVVYVPTLIVDEIYLRIGINTFTPSALERRLADPEVVASTDAMQRPGSGSPPEEAPVHAVSAANLVRVAAAGVTIAAGSDAGNVRAFHGPALHRELERMVAAGLEHVVVLRAASFGGAVMMGRANDLGTVETGKLADFVILDADPIADIRNTTAIWRVVKGGEVFDPAEILADLP